MKQIVVLGAGIGGIAMAYELRHVLGKRAAITVVSDTEWFQFVPSNPWVSVGWRKPEDIKIHLPEVMAKYDIAFTASGAAQVRAEKNQVLLGDGSELDYDYLVIATGPELAFDEIEGLGPEGFTSSVCHVDHAALAEEKWRQFCAEPGPMVVGAVQGASCFGPAYEYALLAATDLRKKKIRDQVPITFVTSEPYIGHLGLGGVGDTKSQLESLMRERDVKWITNARVERITADAVEVVEVDDTGVEKKRHTLPSKHNMFIPGFRGVKCLRDAAGEGFKNLCNPRGFVLVDEYQCNPTYRNVYAVGVCVAIPPIEQTPVAVGAPKTGYMIESMVAAVGANIRHQIEGREPSDRPTLNAVCLADFGDSGVAFVALPQFPPRNLNWSSEGYWVHLAKIGFEKYFLHKVRAGSAEPGYERIVMKALGIERLKGN
ncbi:MAG: FAD-dependent oxidoreductase [Haliea sp.]|uniref:NAD(P)/FAD-dependent oxidoreductase n=1 Tax=Haliea sp. TaxID=1932666 RepID=UPI0032ECAB97